MSDILDMNPVEARRLFQNLIESPGWKALEQIVEEQAQQRRQEMCSPMLPGGEYTRQWIGGELSGLGIVMGTPTTLIEYFSIQIEQRKEETK